MASWGQAFVDFENKNVYESAIMCIIYVGWLHILHTHTHCTYKEFITQLTTVII